MIKKFTIIFWFSFIALSFAVQDVHSAVNPRFTPRWKVGDSWDVVMREMYASIPGALKTIEAGGHVEHPGEPSSIHFAIVDYKEIDGEVCYVVDITYKNPTNEYDATTALHLYVREEDFTLLKITNITKDSVGNIVQEIDFNGHNAHDYIIFERRSFPIPIPCDFPNFPAANTNEERTIDSPRFGIMTQKITFVDENTLKIELSRKVGTRFYKTTQIWERDKPWWSSAKRTITHYDYDTGEEKESRVEFDPVLLGTDTVPPALQLTVAPVMLWPPNHQMVEVMPTVTATDDYDRFPEVKLYAVESSEPDDAPGAGDGNTTQDIETSQVWDNKQHKMVDKILLRAERDGQGTGRIYTITYTATDFSGNISKTSAVVTVPHDAGKV